MFLVVLIDTTLEFNKQETCRSISFFFFDKKDDGLTRLEFYDYGLWQGVGLWAHETG